MTAGPGPQARQALQLARMIAVGTAAGATVFALVAWFLHRRSPPPGDRAQAELMFNLWLLLALGALVAAIVFWRTRIAPLIERSPASPAPRAYNHQLLTRLVITWSLVDGASLAGVVIYFAFGSAWAGAAALALMWLAMAATWPQPRWFGLAP